MRLYLSDDDAAFADELRDFFTTRIPHSIRETVRERRELTKAQHVEAMRIMNAAGIAVPNWPVEWGGRDWTPLQRHIWYEEMHRAAVPVPLMLNASMIGPVLAEFGSAELKRRFLPPTANLDIWWAQGFSEPGAGSDLASLVTSAVHVGDEYVVNGQKTWTTHAQHADWMFALVRTDRAAKKQAGISMLLIDMRSPGVTVRPIALVAGGHEVNEVFLDDVRVPEANLVGVENRGWAYAKFLLGNERVGAAPVGIMKRDLSALREFAAEEGLLQRPAVQSRLVDIENTLVALELTAIRVTAASDDGEPHPASSILKLRGTEIQQEITALWMDLGGERAIVRAGAARSDVPAWVRGASEVYLNFRKTSIYGGSNEIQRQIIAGAILGLRA
ncbi:acyl-CoA dehydrogenase family protein [Pseudonocardia xishanensis]|uniref:Acyl-CoA dehydrogenase family protein n=1 Tax=Pseudonocardia xishanensis TaxID=630995 RepID=A0ABP8RZA4_9PSEU